jgi:hypothetical protein
MRRHLPFLLFGVLFAVLAGLLTVALRAWFPDTQSWWWLPWMLGDAVGQLGRQVWRWIDGTEGSKPMTQMELPVYGASDPPPECPRCKTPLGLFARTRNLSEYPDWAAYRCSTCNVGVVRLEERPGGPHA